MRVALVHDYIKEYGGAERVLEALHTIYPEAPIYTLIYAPEFLGPHKERFTSFNIKPSLLQFIPFSYKFVSLYRLIAPFIFKTFDFKNYDVIIVSATGAYNPNSIKKQKAKQICYCHTPPRYLYGFATARKVSSNGIFRFCVSIMNHVLRIIDYYSSKNVDLFIANSENVAARIRKFYRQDAVVIYPPVSLFPLADFHKEEKKGSKSFYLAGGRLARAKHIDLIIKACAVLHKPLKIFGKGFAGYEDELRVLNRELNNKNIEFLGEVNDEEKLVLLQQAKGYIFAGEDEDFGILPIEAMAMGTPVISYKSGGPLESIIENETGLFFDSLDVKSLEDAIKRFEKKNWNADTCMKQAKKFSFEIFAKEVKKVVEG